MSETSFLKEYARGYTLEVLSDAISIIEHAEVVITGTLDSGRQTLLSWVEKVKQL